MTTHFWKNLKPKISTSGMQHLQNETIAKSRPKIETVLGVQKKVRGLKQSPDLALLQRSGFSDSGLFVSIIGPMLMVYGIQVGS
jgi:hypothetical protein